ncbi:polyisoprenoid diphosphate/phosphate phosphohydrolase PLPP6-like [Montipora foliosa]|uniref:polyisoprenoid diphosphate/phosphate phosphohydrolase PLPP6-like n=1 Tax=Montipora foliosa TaxID=591990 RepID=UPI0035F12662
MDFARDGLKSEDNTGHRRKKVTGFNEDLSKPKNKGNIPVTFFASFLHLVDCLYRFDIFLSNKLSVCADKNSGSWRTLMVILEYTGHGIPWTAAALFVIFAFSDTAEQEFACNLLLALSMDLAIVSCLKAVVRRERPVNNVKDMFATVSVDHYSFPSGHSSRSAMVAGLFAVFLAAKVWSLFIGCWAVCVSASRVILGRHHLSDVLCGVVIGLLQSWVICALWIPYTSWQQLSTLLPF